MPTDLRKTSLGLIAAVALAAGLGSCGGGGKRTTATTPKLFATSEIRLPGGAKGVWGPPSNGGAPKGLLLLIHGGGWGGISQPGFQSMLALAPHYQRLGFETLTVDYRRGSPGIADVEQLYSIARRRVGPRFPICAAGPSAGGHIALVLAMRYPDLACVLDFAGPTDLAALKTEPNGAVAYELAVQAFGTGGLAAFSPALHAGSIKAKLLLIYAQNDPVVPVAQGYEMARADPRAKLIVLPPGTRGFVHTGVGVPPQDSGVSASANARATREEDSFLVAAATRR